MTTAKRADRAVMQVIAGPPGSGKITYFPVGSFGVDAFSIDDRCRVHERARERHTTADCPCGKLCRVVGLCET